MPFEKALSTLRTGRYALARRNWRATLRFAVGSGDLWLFWPSGAWSKWRPTQDDLLAEDWEIRC